VVVVVGQPMPLVEEEVVLVDCGQRLVFLLLQVLH
jgi:hypothetical protein